MESIITLTESNGDFYTCSVDASTLHNLENTPGFRVEIIRNFHAMEVVPNNKYPPGVPPSPIFISLPSTDIVTPAAELSKVPLVDESEQPADNSVGTQLTANTDSKSSTSPTVNKVRIENLPYGTWDDELFLHVEEFLRKLGCEPKITSCIIQNDFSSAEVEFGSAASAAFALKLNGTQYEENLLKVSVIDEVRKIKVNKLLPSVEMNHHAGSSLLSIKNLPYGTWDDELESLIVKVLQDVHKESQHPLHSLIPLKCIVNSNFTSATVEFSSSASASLAREVLDGFCYENHKLQVVAIFPSANHTGNFTSILIDNLPFGTVDNTIVEFILGVMGEANAGSLIKNCCVKFDFTSAEVEFFSHEQAREAIAKLHGKEFQDQVISVRFTQPGMDSVFVKFDNLPFGTLEGVLREMVEDLLFKAGFHAVTAQQVIKCITINNDFVSAAVEFSSVNVAKAILNMNGYLFEDHALLITSMPQTAPLVLEHQEISVEQSDRDNSILVVEDIDELETDHIGHGDHDQMDCLEVNFSNVAARDVFIHNLPFGVTEEEVKDFLLEYFSLNGFKYEGSAAIQNCTVFTSGIFCNANIEFSSERYTAAAMSLDGQSFKGHVLEVSTEPFSNSSASHYDIDAEDEADHMGTDDEDQTDEENKERKPIKDISSDYGTKALLRECLALKKGSRKFIGTAKIWAKVAANLKKLNILATAEDCRNRKKNLDEHYRRQISRNSPTISSWLYYKPIAALRGDIDIPDDWLDINANVTSSHDVTEKCSSRPSQQMSYGRSLHAYSHGVVWPDKAVRCLISIVTEKKADYDKPERHDAFWDEVNKEMFKNNFSDYDRTHLKDKMDRLKSKFKDITDDLNRTGCGKISWDYYELLVPLLGDDVSVKPIKTFAIGSSNVIATNKSFYESKENGQERLKPTTKFPLKKQHLQDKNPSLKELNSNVKQLLERLSRTN